MIGENRKEEEEEKRECGKKIRYALELSLLFRFSPASNGKVPSKDAALEEEFPQTICR